MALSPRSITRTLPNGETITIGIRYVRPFSQRVTVRFCFLHTAGIDHACDDFGCWDFDEGES